MGKNGFNPLFVYSLREILVVLSMFGIYNKLVCFIDKIRWDNSNQTKVCGKVYSGKKLYRIGV